MGCYFGWVRFQVWRCPVNAMPYVPPAPVNMNFTGTYTPPASNTIVIDLDRSGDTDQSQVVIQAAAMLIFAL